MTETEAAMAASALFILDLKGSIILYRDYRGDVPIKFAERFITKLNELEEAGKVINSCLFAFSSQHPLLLPCILSIELSSTVDNHAPTLSRKRYFLTACTQNRTHYAPWLLLQVTPIIQADGVSYMYVQYSNLYLLVVTRENVNAASMLLFLHKLKEVFVHYFNELEEESLRDNFVIAYELLDEVRTSSCMNRHHISCSAQEAIITIPFEQHIGLHCGTPGRCLCGNQ